MEESGFFRVIALVRTHDIRSRHAVTRLRENGSKVQLNLLILGTAVSLRRVLLHGCQGIVVVVLVVLVVTGDLSLRVGRHKESSTEACFVVRKEDVGSLSVFGRLARKCAFGSINLPNLLAKCHQNTKKWMGT